MVRPAMPPHKFAKPIGRQALSAVTHRDHRIWANPYGHRAPGWRHPDSILDEVPQGGGDRFAPAPSHGMPATCIERDGFPFRDDAWRQKADDIAGDPEKGQGFQRELRGGYGVYVGPQHELVDQATQRGDVMLTARGVVMVELVKC